MEYEALVVEDNCFSSLFWRKFDDAEGILGGAIEVIDGAMNQRIYIGMPEKYGIVSKGGKIGQYEESLGVLVYYKDDGVGNTTDWRILTEL